MRRFKVREANKRQPLRALEFHVLGGIRPSTTMNCKNLPKVLMGAALVGLPGVWAQLAPEPDDSSAIVFDVRAMHREMRFEEKPSGDAPPVVAADCRALSSTATAGSVIAAFDAPPAAGAFCLLCVSARLLSPESRPAPPAAFLTALVPGGALSIADILSVRGLLTANDERTSGRALASLSPVY
jgi:hypothetical protein